MDAEKFANFEDPPPDLQENEEIWANTLILREILKHLTSVDLLTCRQVNHVWCIVATTALRKREDIKVELEFDSVAAISTMPTFRRGYSQVNNNVTSTRSPPLKHPRLSDLTECMSKCGENRFPCVNFSILNVPDLNWSDFREFLTSQGRFVRELTLSLSSLKQPDVGPETGIVWTDKQLGQFRNILVNQLPRLERLHLIYYNSEGHAGFSRSRRLFPEISGSKKNRLNVEILPGLKHLTVSSNDFPYIGEIFRAAPNLEEFRDLSLDLRFLDDSVTAGKGHTLKHLYFNRTVRSDLQQIMNLVEVSSRPKSRYPQLASISLAASGTLSAHCESDRKFDERARGAISQLLQWSQRSLTKVTMEVTPDTGRHLDWPRLENVTSLGLNHYCYAGVPDLNPDPNSDEVIPPIFPSGFFSRVFPHVKSVSFHGILSHRDVFQDLLLSTNLQLMTSVIELTFSYDFLPKYVAGKLAQIFPNVETLKIVSRTSLQRWAGNGAIWGFTNLRQLDLQLQVSYICPDHWWPHLDSFFTGFSRNTCRKLKNRHNFLDKMVKREEKSCGSLRRGAGGSILSCNKLEFLKINFVCRNDYLPKQYRLLSPSSTGRFAFGLMTAGVGRTACKLDLLASTSITGKKRAWRKKLKAGLEPMRQFVHRIEVQL